MSTTATQPPQSQLSTALARDRLGVAAVVFFVMSAAAPLTVVAGVVPTGLAVTGLTGISIAFLAVAVVLAIFAVGYVAMARHIANAGAFYAYISQGIGRPFGVGASWVALVAYNMLPGRLVRRLRRDRVTAVQGLVRPRHPVVGAGPGRAGRSSRCSACATWRSTARCWPPCWSPRSCWSWSSASPTCSRRTSAASSAPLDPGSLVGAGSGALLAMAVTGFVGFEQSVVFSEESRDPRRTVPRGHLHRDRADRRAVRASRPGR